MSRIDRRTVLKGGAVAAAAALTSCSDTKPATAVPAGPDWDGFRRGLQGRLYRPGDSGFAASHQLFNTRFDSIEPAGVVRISTVDDVRESIR